MSTSVAHRSFIPGKAASPLGYVVVLVCPTRSRDVTRRTDDIARSVLTGFYGAGEPGTVGLVDMAPRGTVDVVLVDRFADLPVMPRGPLTAGPFEVGIIRDVYVRVGRHSHQRAAMLLCDPHCHLVADCGAGPHFSREQLKRRAGGVLNIEVSAEEPVASNASGIIPIERQSTSIWSYAGSVPPTCEVGRGAGLQRRWRECDGEFPASFVARNEAWQCHADREADQGREDRK